MKAANQPANAQALELLLRALLTPGDTDLPAATGLSCTQIASLASDPAAAELIGALSRVVEARARITAAQSLVGSIAALEKVMTEAIQNPRHAETVRKAASGIIRLHESLNRRAACASQPKPSRPLDLHTHHGASTSEAVPDTGLDAMFAVTPHAAAWLASAAPPGTSADPIGRAVPPPSS